MKVKMNQNLATVAMQYTQGQEYDLPDDEARRLIEGGIATDPSGAVKRKHETGAASPARQTLDRNASTPAEKLPSSLNIPGHPYKDPASTTLTTDRVPLGQPAPAAATGVEATNAPSAAETKKANEQQAPLSEQQPGDKKPAAAPAPAGKSGK